MNPLSYLFYLIRLSHSEGIARRYLITNGFDGAFTMLGLNMGFYVAKTEDLWLVFHACLGAIIALTMSGLSSAYISEAAERKKVLKELERAMIADLSHSTHAQAARWIPVWVAFVNGVAPLMVAMIIMSPVWLSLVGLFVVPHPVEMSIGLALLLLFSLGAYAGKIGGTSILKTGLRTLFIGIAISLIVLAIG